MSRFLEVYEPVNEGWGYTLVHYGLSLGILSPLITGAGAVIGGISGAAIGAGVSLGSFTFASALNAILQPKAKAYLEKILHSKPFIDYVSKKCDEIYHKELTEDKSATYKIPKNPKFFTHYYSFNGGKRSSAGHSAEAVSHIKHELIIGKYTVWIFYDTNHVNSVFLLLYHKDSKYVIPHRIPSPTTKELKDQGYYIER